jgi:hypothetical protein
MTYVRETRRQTWFAKHCPTFASAIDKTTYALTIRSIASRLDSKDPIQRQFLAWKLKCMAEEGKDLSHLVQLLGPKKIMDIFLNTTPAEFDLASVLLISIKNRGTDVSFIFDHIDRWLSCPDTMHSIPVNVLSLLRYANLGKQRAMDIVIRVLKDPHILEKVQGIALEVIYELTIKGADPSASFGIAAELMKKADIDVFGTRPRLFISARHVLNIASIRGFDLSPIIDMLFNTNQWTIIRHFAENGGEVARNTIPPRVFAIMQSPDFLFEADRNSEQYVRRISCFAEVMYTMQMAEKGLNHAASAAM